MRVLPHRNKSALCLCLLILGTLVCWALPQPRLPGRLLVVDNERLRVTTMDPNDGLSLPLAEPGSIVDGVLSPDRKLL